MVRGARVLESIEHHVDLKAIGLALRFEFEPALDTTDHPIADQRPWHFVVQG